jgi:hypothetical protein
MLINLLSLSLSFRPPSLSLPLSDFLNQSAEQQREKRRLIEKIVRGSSSLMPCWDTPRLFLRPPTTGQTWRRRTARASLL